MNVSIERILALKFLPIIDFESIKNIEAFIETVLEQDVSVLQINFKTPQQIEKACIFKTLAQKYPEMSFGAGFFYSGEDAEKLLKCGIEFVVSSVLEKDILDIAATYNKTAIVSGFTPTEIYEAYKTKEDLVQIFPASQIHYKSIISVLEYLPNANFILTGGLTISSALEFLRHGAKAVGLKGALFSKKDLINENYKEIGCSIKNFKDRAKILDLL